MGYQPIYGPICFSNTQDYFACMLNFNTIKQPIVTLTLNGTTNKEDDLESLTISSLGNHPLNYRNISSGSFSHKGHFLMS